MTETFAPGRQLKQVKDYKERFAEMNAWVTSRGGWVTSTPGAPEITVDCRSSSSIPDELAKAGHRIEEIGASERITPHNGIVAVRRYSLRLG